MNNNLVRYPSPIRLLIITLCSMFIGEALVMLFLDFLKLNKIAEGALDAFLLSIIMIPPLFFFLYKPMVKHIQHQQKLQEEVQESELKFRTISNSANDAIIMINHEGLITYWNGYAEKVFGYSTEEIMNQDLHKIITPHHYDAFHKGFQHFKETGEGAIIGKAVELTAFKKGGIEFPVEVSISAVQHEGKWFSIGIVRDISERKTVEEKMNIYRKHLEDLFDGRSIELQITIQELQEEIDERKKIEEELRSAQERLINHEKRAMVGELATGFAHEMKNQLNPIGYLEIIQNNLPDEEKEFIRYIFDARDRIISLIDEIRGLARNEETNYEKSHHSLKNLIDETVKLIQMDHDVRRHNFLIDHNFDEEIIINRDKIIQVFFNLIRNSAHALAKTENGTIGIKTERENNHVLIHISDNGTGIEESQLKKIWNPFFTTKGKKGTGVGLDICKRIIEGHNGKISCVSQPGINTTFTISLPLNK